MLQARQAMKRMTSWTAHHRQEAMLNMDKARLANLGSLDHEVAKLALLIAEMERIVRDARGGIYRQDVVSEDEP